MIEQLKMIKQIEDEETRCEMIQELIAMKDAEIKLLKNIIEECRIVMKANGIYKTDERDFEISTPL